MLKNGLMYILKNQNNSPTTLLKLTFSLKIFGVEIP